MGNRVLVVSMFRPAREKQLGGGAQVLADALAACATRGLQVTVLSPANERGSPDFGPNVTILPVLRTWRTWEDGSRITMHRRLLDLQEIALHSRGADVVLTVEQPFPFRGTTPVVLMLQTPAYWEAAQSLFYPTYDRVVVPSPYVKRTVDDVTARLWRGGAPPVDVLPLSVDSDHFRPIDPALLAKRLNLPLDLPCLLCPHRSDPDKGFEMAVRILAELRNRGRPYRLLVPQRGLLIPECDPRRGQEVALRRALTELARSLGVDDLLFFHEWLTVEDYPAYLSLGEWTLRVGSLPEGFGLTPIQSILCGTPVLATPAGALAETLPPRHGLRRVWYDDVSAAVGIILHDHPSPVELGRGRRYVARVHSQASFGDALVTALLKTTKFQGVFDPLSDHADSLAPWCIEEQGVVWSDADLCEVPVDDDMQKVIDGLRGGLTLDGGLWEARRRALEAGLILGALEPSRMTDVGEVDSHGSIHATRPQKREEKNRVQ